MSEWKEVTLHEIGTLARGKSKHRPRWADHLYGGVVPFIQTGDIRKANKLISEFEQTYSSEGVAQSKLWKKGTLCITIAANIAEIGILDFDACFPDSVLGFIPDKNYSTTDFVFYLLKHFQKQIQIQSIGSVQENINLGTFERIKSPIPPLPEQKAIAHILGILDEKIELNRKMNQTLEAMAQALFKSWFVDFDPVIDNALAQGNEIPEKLQARAEKRRRVIAGTVIASAAKQSSQSLNPLLHTNPSLAAQFPASFVFNETLGKWIPEGWEVKTIGELSDVISKGTTPRESDTEGMKLSIPFIKVRDIDDQGNLSFDLDLIPKEVHLKQLKRSILKKDDLLFSIAGTIGRVAVLPFRLHNSNCNQAVAFIRLSDKKKYNILVHQFLRSDIIQSEIHSKVVQAVQANTSLKNLSDLKIVVSDIETIESFNNAMNEFYNRIALNKEKTETLTQLRDRLLPELISGRVRVGNFNQNET